ncbi:MAG: tetratricopeptide repeat protein [Desulfovibrionaceae bacterium]|nr:tetratricopeptide repeat protein [Desulfovibrionaceae bacterium]
MTEAPCVSRRERAVLLLLGASICCMLLVFLVDRLRNPSLVVQVASMPKQEARESAMPGGDEIGALMRELKEKPHDLELMNSLAEALMNAEQWDAAATFVDRALSEDSKNFTAHFLKGIILHKKGRYEEAAKALEAALAIKDDARARYSAAVLYLYFLKNKELGRKHLERGLALPDLPKDMKDLFTKEMDALAQ